MQLYLIRHPQPVINPGVCYGRSDLDIAPDFCSSEQNWLTHLHSLQADIVISSPALRCRRLAEALASNWISDERLLELNFGDWEMQAWDSIPIAAMRFWSDDYVNRAPPGGESFQQLASRVEHWLNELCRNHNQQRVLVITHAGVIRALLAQILQLPLADSFKFSIDYGSCSALHYTDHGWHISFINR